MERETKKRNRGRRKNRGKESGVQKRELGHHTGTDRVERVCPLPDVDIDHGLKEPLIRDHTVDPNDFSFVEPQRSLLAATFPSPLPLSGERPFT